MNERGRRLLWFAGLWCAGVAVLALLAFVIRAAMMP
ncbi:MAG: DUF2474 domain-containing protein [Rhodospirillales bacterium]